MRPYGGIVIVTRQLVARLEASSAHAAMLLVRAIDAGAPGTGADHLPFGRGVLVASGAGRYVNRAVGISLDEILQADLQPIEAWYLQRRLRPMIEVSAWAPASTLATFAASGYGPAWFRAMLVHQVRPRRQRSEPASVVAVETEEDAARWRSAFSEGFNVTQPEALEVSDEHARADRRIDGARQFLAIVGGTIAGCCSVTLANGIAWLGAAATIPAHRHQGVHATMVRHRLDYAHDNGCDLAAVTALADGASARNLVRLGFQLVQHQLVLQAPS